MKRNPLIVSTVLVLLVSLLVCACSRTSSEPPELEVPQEYVPTIAQTTQTPVQESIDMYSATLYYSDGFGHLVPISQKIAWQEGIAKTVLFQLSRSADTDTQYAALGLYATLPEDINIDLDISGGLARVDLISSQLPSDAQEQKLMAASVVNTLMDFDTVKSVKLLFNHEPMANFEDGTQVPVTYTAPVANYESDVVPDEGESTATLYFCNSTGDFLVPLERTGPIHDAQTALRQLTQIQENSGLVSVLPENCEVIEVRLQEDSALVNLSESFRKLVGDDAALARAYQGIAETIRPYGDFKTLEIYVEGELFEWSTQTMADGSLSEINTLP